MTMVQRMAPAGLVFDLDDTLYPERMFVEGGLAAVASILDSRFPADWKWLTVLTGILNDEGPFSMFDRALEKAGIPRDQTLIDELVTAFRNHAPLLRPWPGVVDMLRSLRAAGAMTAIVTDGYLDVQQSKFRALGIAELFDAVVFCADVDGAVHPKPDPAGFIKVASLLADVSGQMPRPLVYIGDNPSRDFPAPDSLGWKTVRVRRPGIWHLGQTDPQPGRPCATDTAELFDLLKQYITMN